MKAILTLLGGLVLAVLVFVGGVVAATKVLATTKEPTRPASANVSQLWTNEPVKIDTAAQALQRIPPRETRVDAPRSDDGKIRPSNVEMAKLDQTAPSTVISSSSDLIATKANGGDTAEEADLSSEHLEWCANRYRSYRPRDNSYTPFTGGRRRCESPYSVRTTATGNVAWDSNAVSPSPRDRDSFESSLKPIGYSEPLVADVRPATYGTWEHAQSCFSRYRSYRPEDNTYQPIGGGTRRQCQ